MPVHHQLPPHIQKNRKVETKVEEIQNNNPRRVIISLKCYRKRPPGNTEQEKEK